MVSSPHVQTLFDIWFSFHVVGGHFLIPVLLVTFVLSKAKRDATLINFGLTISFSSVINCLLLYTHEYLGPEPNKGLCIAQAAAFGASAPMWSVAALTLILQIKSRVEIKPVRWLLFMLIAPYMFFIVFFVVILVVGSRHPDKVTRARRTLYCSIESRVISLVTICFTSATALVAIGIGAMMSYRLYNFLSMVRRERRPQIRVVPLATRLLIFMVYLFFALLTSLWSIKDRHTFIRDLYTSTFGVAYFLVFGTQRDVFKAWCFWRKNPMETHTVSTETGAHSADEVIVPHDDFSQGNVSLLTDIDIKGTTTQESESILPSSSPVYTHPTYTRHYTTKNVHIVVTSTRTEA